MKDPEIELKRRLHNLQTGQNLTYEEFCLYEIKTWSKLIKFQQKILKRQSALNAMLKTRLCVNYSL